MITSLTLAKGTIRMAREKVIVRRLASIEDLGSMDVLCNSVRRALRGVYGAAPLGQRLDWYLLDRKRKRSPRGRQDDKRCELGSFCERVICRQWRSIHDTQGWFKCDYYGCAASAL
jgi:hypothetical protein